MDGQTKPSGMSPRRLRIVCGTIVFFVTAELIAIAGKAEMWPFSYFPVYCEVARPGPIEIVRLVGYRADQPNEEYPIVRTAEVRPYAAWRLSLTLQKQLVPQGKEACEAWLHRFLERYEARRRAGEHSGPPLSGVAMQQHTWNLDMTEQNVRPADRVELVAQISSLAN